MQGEKKQDLRRGKKNVQKIVFWILLVVCCSIIGLVFWAPFTSHIYVRSIFESEFSNLLGAPVTFEKIDLDFFPAGLKLENIQLHSPVSSIKKLHIRSIDTSFDLRSLFLGRLTVSYAEVLDPDIEFQIHKQKNTSQKKSFELSPSSPLSIEDLEVKNARLKITLPSGMSFTVLPDDIAYQQEGYSQLMQLDGRGVFEKDTAQLQVENVSVAVMKFGDQVFIQKFEVSDEVNTVVAEGVIYPVVDFGVIYTGELEKIEEVLKDLSILKKDLHMSGQVFIESAFQSDDSSILGQHQLDFKGISIAQRKVNKIGISLETQNDSLVSGEIQLQHNQSKAKINLTQTATKNVLGYTVHSEKMSFEEIQYWISPLIDPILFSDVRVISNGTISLYPFNVEGSLEVDFPSVTFDIPENVTSFLPIEIQNARTECLFLWDQKNGVRFDQGHLIHENLDGDFYIYITEGENSSVIEGNWEVAVKNINALFVPDYPINGDGLITGFIRQAEEQSRLQFDFDLKNFAYADFAKHEFQGAISFLGDKMLFEDMVLRNRRKGRLEFFGEVSNENDNFELNANFSHFDMGWVSTIVGRRYPAFNKVKGYGDGALQLTALGDDIDGEISMRTQEAFVFDIPVDEIDVRFVFEGENIHIEKANVHGNILSANAKGNFARNAFDQVVIHAEKIPLAPLAVPSFFTSYVNAADADLILDGDYANPSIDLRAKLFLQQDVVETPYIDRARMVVEGSLEKYTWELYTLEPGMQFEGDIVSIGDQPFTFSGTWENFPVLSIIENSKSSITGFVSGSGQAKDFSTWNAQASIKEIKLENEYLEFYNKFPFDLEMNSGSVKISGLAFGNQTHEVVVSGKIGGDQTLALKARGVLPFESLSTLPLNLTRVEGVLEIDLGLQGTIAEPVLQGDMVLHNGYLRHKSFPHPFESVEVQASIDQNLLHARSIIAMIGGGELNGEGDLFLSRDPDDMKLYFTGTLDQVNLRFPEYLPVLVRGPFSVEGDLLKPLLKSDLEVISGMYTDQWDWQSQVLSFSSEQELERIYREEEESMLFDMRFYSDNNNFLVRNDVAVARVKGDIILRGSDRRFGLLGNVEIVEGQVTFLENRFDMLPGVVSFIRDDEIAMSFNLNARTRVQNTDILLDIRTEQEVIRAYLSSIPQKEETAIISLLTLGVELDDLAISSGVNEGVSASLIPSVLSGPFQSRVESGLKKIKLVDSFQFIPYFSEDTKTTGLKLFVAKNLFSKVRLTYSTDVFAAGNENTFTLEQFLNDKVSLQGSFRDNKAEADQDIDVGFDFEYRTEF
ncbi:MAG: translocation/assembly module TamB domain-containing protein [Deltaproteobacteria bacterium]|nr:translocation/assembly module TamB domain-containing protein [Deltaproteobacteria bacterium]